MTRGPITDKREKEEGGIAAMEEIEDTPEKWEERRKERKLIMKERLIGALAGEVDIEDIQIEVEGGEFARWVMETGQEEPPRKKTEVLHRRNRVSAEKNIKEWDRRLGYELGTKEEISKLQLEDKTLNEVRQRAIK